MWLARGPAVRSDEWMWGAESVDLAPTLMMLLGLPIASDLDGRALVRMLRKPITPQRVSSWNNRAAPGPFAEASSTDEQMGMRRMCEDGFLDPSEISRPNAVEHAQDDIDFALARVYAETARPADACRVLEPLCRRRGDVEAWLLLLARVYQDLGDLPACRRLVEQSLAGGVSRLHRALVECTLLCGERRFADALDTLLDVEQSHPDHAGLHCHIGDVYLDLHRWEDAARAFRRSLKIEPASSRAFLGLTIAALAGEKYEQAIDLAQSAIRLTYHLPMAHYHLGVALSKCGRCADAARSFETCLEQRPNTPEAHAWLAHIYISSLSDPEKARRHQSMAVGPKSKH
jgi:tetratricopeptide (TPR) repeat protein